MTRPVVLSLFDHSGRWSDPWRKTHDVIQCDIQNKPPIDVMELAESPEALPPIDVLLAAPPCTAFTNANRKSWAKYDAGRGGSRLRTKQNESTSTYVALVYAVLVLVQETRPRVWAMENPRVGRIEDLVPELKAIPRWDFYWHNFAGYADVPEKEAEFKWTRIWGNSRRPPERNLPPNRYGGEAGGTKAQTATSRVPAGPNQANIRSMTPQGFARAFYEANR